MKEVGKGRKASSGRKARETRSDSLRFSARSYWLFGAGFAAIVVGYVFLSKGSITAAPILLVAGYCALVPLAIFMK
jgi:hypothetical protein